MTLSLLGSATWSVPDFVRTDLRTVRLAIAAWEKGASWRDRGWAGENNRAAMGPCTHRKSREATIHLYGEGKTRRQFLGGGTERS